MTKLPVRAPRAKSSASDPSDPADPADIASSAPARALAALGFSPSARLPTPDTSVQDLLLYAVTYRAGPRPDLDIVLVVAAELEALSMFIEGPLHVTLGTASRRLRVAVDLAHRLAAATTALEVA